MLNWFSGKLGFKSNMQMDAEYLECIREVLGHKKVLSMRDYMHHKEINCLDHCLYVSYCSYILCRRLGCDWKSAARGGLLHDFFLYDWHEKDRKGRKGWHGFTHPQIALYNAKLYFRLNEVEEDIISKHMWPLTIKIPRYKESYIVVLIDKYCTVMEICNRGKWNNIRSL